MYTCLIQTVLMSARSFLALIIIKVAQQLEVFFSRNISIVNVHCFCFFCAYFRTFRSFLGPAAVLCAREHACVTVRMYIAVNII